MINYLLSLLGFRRDLGCVAAGRPRNPGWKKLSKLLKDEYPFCQCCDEPTTVIHHCVPFHVSPELELDETNLIALCDACHLRIGHGCNFRCWLPDCRRLAGTIRAAIAARSE